MFKILKINIKLTKALAWPTYPVVKPLSNHSRQIQVEKNLLLAGLPTSSQQRHTAWRKIIISLKTLLFSAPFSKLCFLHHTSVLFLYLTYCHIVYSLTLTLQPVCQLCPSFHGGDGLLSRYWVPSLRGLLLLGAAQPQVCRGQYHLYVNISKWISI